VAAVAGKALLKRFKAIHNATTIANKSDNNGVSDGEGVIGGGSAAAAAAAAAADDDDDDEEASDGLGGMSYKEIKVELS
jgi:hypothetical protein